MRWEGIPVYMKYQSLMIIGTGICGINVIYVEIADSFFSKKCLATFSGSSLQQK